MYVVPSSNFRKAHIHTHTHTVVVYSLIQLSRRGMKMDITVDISASPFVLQRLSQLKRHRVVGMSNGAWCSHKPFVPLQVDCQNHWNQKFFVPETFGKQLFQNRVILFLFSLSLFFFTVPPKFFPYYQTKKNKKQCSLVNLLSPSVKKAGILPDSLNQTCEEYIPRQ